MFLQTRPTSIPVIKQIQIYGINHQPFDTIFIIFGQIFVIFQTTKQSNHFNLGHKWLNRPVQNL